MTSADPLGPFKFQWYIEREAFNKKYEEIE